MKLYYKGGYFDIPQLSFKMAGTNKTTVPDDTAFKEIDENAIKIPVADTWSEWQSVKVEANRIYTQETPPKPSEYYYYNKEYIYELYNGNILYIGGVQGNVINMDVISLTKVTATTPIGNQFVYPNMTSYKWSVSPSIYYEYWNEWYHYFYMFFDSDGDLFMGYVGTGSTTKTFKPGPISPDSPEWVMLFGDNVPPPPKFEDDDSKDSGGDGEYTFISEEVPIPNLPLKSAVDTGFVTLYNPTNDQLKTLAEYLWTSDFTTAIKKMFSDPMDAILSLSFMPVKPLTSGPREIKVGFIGTGVDMNVVAEQFMSFSCGSINIKEQWGNYLDYSPFTKVSIYLPYIGERQLDIDDVMKNSIEVVYHIDLLSGTCIAFICATPDKAPKRVLYTFPGMCSTPLPVSGRDFSELVRAGIGLLVTGASTVISGGGGVSAVSSILTSTASNINAAKPQIQNKSNISSSSGLMGIQTPYLIFSYPRQSLAENYRVFQGYPSNTTSKLKNLTGYTVIEQIHLENIPATEEENAQIEALLKGGVII